MFSLEVRRNRKAPNGVKLNALQNGYIIFWTFVILTPKSQISIFKKYLPIKSKFFHLSKKPEYMGLRYIQTTRIQNFKAFLAVQWQKKTGKGDDVTCLKCTFWHF